MEQAFGLARGDIDEEPAPEGREDVAPTVARIAGSHSSTRKERTVDLVGGTYSPVRTSSRSSS